MNKSACFRFSSKAAMLIRQKLCLSLCIRCIFFYMMKKYFICSAPRVFGIEDHELILIEG